MKGKGRATLSNVPEEREAEIEDEIAHSLGMFKDEHTLMNHLDAQRRSRWQRIQPKLTCQRNVGRRVGVLLLLHHVLSEFCQSIVRESGRVRVNPTSLWTGGEVRSWTCSCPSYREIA
ncbi:hypothetical protein H2248_009057 [Termitomyces sp. 'cryptogamus']|nr:hypothetical protein H2248_009057 [Termitomyces sp. 'cryptogamus']